MMLGEPQPTRFDLNFKFLGYGVRVTPWFWLMSLILGFSISQPEFVEYATGQPTDLPTPIFLMLWTAAIFISILIHELGHAIAFKHYGVSSHIVLWHFGGIAIPDDMHSHTARIDPRQQMVVSLAGPFAQFIIAGVVLLLAFSAGHAAPVKGTLMDWEFLQRGDPIPNPIIYMFALYLLLPSVFWAAMNLLPVLPLDGGQVARSLLSMHDPYTGIVNSIKLSVVVGGGVALLGFLVLHDKMLAILFGILAVQNFLQLRNMGGFGGGGFGGGGNYGGGGRGRPW